MSDKTLVKYKTIASASTLITIPIENGSMIMTQDTHELYVDMNDVRFCISGYEHVSTVTDLPETPLHKIYVDDNTGTLYVHNGEKYVAIEEDNVKYVTSTSDIATPVEGQVVIISNPNSELNGHMFRYGEYFEPTSTMWSFESMQLFYDTELGGWMIRDPENLGSCVVSGTTESGPISGSYTGTNGYVYTVTVTGSYPESILVRVNGEDRTLQRSGTPSYKWFDITPASTPAESGTILTHNDEKIDQAELSDGLNVIEEGGKTYIVLDKNKAAAIVSTLPTATVSDLGRLIYNNSTKKFYQCEMNGGMYAWNEVTFGSSAAKSEVRVGGTYKAITDFSGYGFTSSDSGGVTTVTPDPRVLIYTWAGTPPGSDMLQGAVIFNTTDNKFYKYTNASGTYKWEALPVGGGSTGGGTTITVSGSTISTLEMQGDGILVRTGTDGKPTAKLDYGKVIEIVGTVPPASAAYVDHVVFDTGQSKIFQCHPAGAVSPYIEWREVTFGGGTVGPVNAIEVYNSLPTPTVDYNNKTVLSLTDRHLYHCTYTGSGYKWDCLDVVKIVTSSDADLVLNDRDMIDWTAPITGSSVSLSMVGVAGEYRTAMIDFTTGETVDNIDLSAFTNGTTIILVPNTIYHCSAVCKGTDARLRILSMLPNVSE